METQSSPIPILDNDFPQNFQTLIPNSPSNFQSISQLQSRLTNTMVDNHPPQQKHSVSDVSIIDLNDYRTSCSRSIKIESKSEVKIDSSHKVVIELLDDDDDDGGGDGDCVFVKKEKSNSMDLRDNKKHPVCINVDDGNDDDDDDDEIRVINVVNNSSFSCKKRSKPFSGVTIVEIGESSGSKTDGIEDVAEEVDPIEVMFVCEICSDSRPRKEAFRIKGCCHEYCCGCIENYVASKLQDGVSRIDCPVPSCSGVLEPEYCREIIPFEVFSRWGNLLCESVILASQKFYCPFKDCSALLVDDGGEMVTMSECPTCNRLFCAQCKVGWHHGIECSEYQSLSKDEREKEDIMLRKLAKSKNWQRCPKCKFYVEKSQGCLYMKCRCGVAFCYRCGSISVDHTYHSCKKCMMVR